MDLGLIDTGCLLEVEHRKKKLYLEVDSSHTGETDQVTDQVTAQVSGQEMKLSEESKTSCFRITKREVQ